MYILTFLPCCDQLTVDQPRPPRINRHLSRGQQTFWELHLDSGAVDLHRRRAKTRPPPPAQICSTRLADDGLSPTTFAPRVRVETTATAGLGSGPVKTPHNWPTNKPRRMHRRPLSSLLASSAERSCCVSTPLAQLDAVRHAKSCHWNEMGGQPTMAPVPAPSFPPSALVLCRPPKPLLQDMAS